MSNNSKAYKIDYYLFNCCCDACGELALEYTCPICQKNHTHYGSWSNVDTKEDVYLYDLICCKDKLEYVDIDLGNNQIFLKDK